MRRTLDPACVACFACGHNQHGVAPNATAIQINGNDHYILNTIVFSSKIGTLHCTVPHCAIATIPPVSCGAMWVVVAANRTDITVTRAVPAPTHDYRFKLQHRAFALPGAV